MPQIEGGGRVAGLVGGAGGGRGSVREGRGSLGLSVNHTR